MFSGDKLPKTEAGSTIFKIFRAQITYVLNIAPSKILSEIFIKCTRTHFSIIQLIKLIPWKSK